MRKKIHNGSSDEESSFIFSSDEREDNAWSDGDYLPPSSDDDDDGDDDENETAASTTKPTPSSRNPRRAPVPKVVTPEETYIKLKTNKRKRNDNNRKNKASAPKAKRKLDFDDSDNSEGSLHGDSKETNADDESFVVVASRSPKIRKIIRDDDIYDGLYDTDDDDEEEEDSKPPTKRAAKEASLRDTDDEEEDFKPRARRTANKASLNDTDEEEADSKPMAKRAVIDLSLSDSDEEEGDSKPPAKVGGKYALRESTRTIKRARRPTIYDEDSDQDSIDEDDSSPLDEQEEERLGKIHQRNDKYQEAEWARENEFKKRFFGQRKTRRDPIEGQPLHTRGFYCCPICYVEAYRRIQFPTSHGDDDSVRDEHDDDKDIETIDFEYGPIEILESLDGGSMKQASAVCFLKLSELKKQHIRVDHGVDVKSDIVKNDLFMRFHTSKGDGLVQRFRNRNHTMTGLGFMSRYWDTHNKKQAKELYEHMKRDRGDAQQFISIFSLRARRIWETLRQAYSRGDIGDSNSDDSVEDDVSKDGDIEDHLNHDLLDREEEQDKEDEAEMKAYVEELERRCKDKSEDEVGDSEEDSDDEEENREVEDKNEEDARLYARGSARHNGDGNGEEDEDEEDDRDFDDDSGDSAQHDDDGSGHDEGNFENGADPAEAENRDGAEGQDPGDTLMAFGKYSDRTYRDVLTYEPYYVDWCMGLSSPSWQMQHFLDYVRHFR